MLNIKEIEGGKLALVFKPEYREVAVKVAQLALQGIIEESKIPIGIDACTQVSKEPTLALVKERVENTPREPFPKLLPKQNEGDIISAIIFEKIKRTFGRELPVYFTVFYKALEKECGYALTEIHRNRVKDKDTREYPYRKIDSILTVLNSQYVKDFADKYKFKTMESVV